MGDVLVCGTNTLIHALRWDALLDLAQQHHSQVHVNKAPNTEKDVSTHKERETPPHTAGQTAHTDTGTCVRSHACAYPVLEEVLAFSLRSPSHFMYIGGVETNALASSEGVLYAACGDSCVHAWSLETRNFLHSFEGHDDYVQCISVRQNGEIISGAEDGVVKFWDSNSQECLNTLSPETMSLKQKKSGTSQAPSQKAGSGASAPSKKTRGRKAKTAAKSEDKVQETLTFIPCLEIDQTDNWLV
ncbi:hypothetical protein SARC_05208 [Sphaeroforma arctica JP610]|uniref:Uncharacterized protein n=1 Tax=Sphaeroforma arctica JP610 TaxID=667725 RepID=A0A0L0G2T7_9EUKA|nr:hypothetical protein SARC_05208 [Sphaeroforma arctica JP610]KNC82508.1 hypothetical protein SARC_05208 [Sphaeroforma arctica JP610]|eukprot:XP_014156410.1 hypothetical protein SARC_05208 [Sphaeroforma arctica JP610]